MQYIKEFYENPVTQRFLRNFFVSFVVYAEIHVKELKTGSGDEIFHVLLVPGLIAAVTATAKALRDKYPDNEILRYLPL